MTITLKYLGVSRSGYQSFLHRKPSATEQRREDIKKDIQRIYDKSKQNYGAPKITAELRKEGNNISERTVGLYMRQMGIRAQWSKPWIATTKDSDFSKELHNILDEQFDFSGRKTPSVRRSGNRHSGAPETGLKPLRCQFASTDHAVKPLSHAGCVSRLDSMGGRCHTA